MASGCILNTDCPVCHELVWEDDAIWFDDQMMHNGCKKEYIKARYGMSEDQFLRLCGSNELRKDIEILKEIEEQRHIGIMNTLKEMESRLERIENKRK